MSLTVACVFVKGHVPFTPEYVIKLQSMARRFITQPFEFVCLTDKPWKFGPEIRTIPIALPPKVKGWWGKIQLFNQKRDWPGRVLYLDLDTLIVDDIQPIIDFPEPFALIPHTGQFDGAEGRQVIKRFNSSVMVWDGGTQTDLYTQWSPLEAKRLWGDQDWIGERHPEAATMPLSWFPRISEAQPPWSDDAKVVLMKRPKNVDAAKQWPWMQEAWA